MTGGLDEDGLIARFFAPLATTPGSDGLRDDAAVFSPSPGEDVVLTADAIVAGVHFFPDDPPDLIARKALRVNLSDLAAKGARPAGYLLTLSLPDAWTLDWLERFVGGLAADQATFQMPLLGGDTVRTPGPLTIAVTALGTLPSGSIVRRSGARPGDVIAVTGEIGSAALGCRLIYEPALAQVLAPDIAEALRARYRLPQPRVDLADAIRAHANAAMDVSDGLAGDAAKICRAAGVGARIAAEAVPLDPAARACLAAYPALLATALTGGDDYEILFTVAPARWPALQAAAAAVGVSVTAIGEVTGAPGLTVTHNGAPLNLGRGSYSHF